MAKKNKAKLPRKERKTEQIKDELMIEEKEAWTAEDKDCIRRQCEKIDNAKMIGTINSFMAKYAVCYHDTWVFVVYNRDKNRLVDFIDVTNLSSEEYRNYELFRSRVEGLRRKQQVKLPEPILPVKTVRQPAPPSAPIDDSEDIDD